MSDVMDKPFPSYLEIPARLPKWFWYLFRAATFAVMASVVWLVAYRPELGFDLFWKLLIPSLPFLFAVAPGDMAANLPDGSVKPDPPNPWFFAGTDVAS